MIKKWKIENFKSFRDRTELDFSPITVIVGANSSGKSSIIQTILLLKQAFQYGQTSEPLLLNGPLIRLGNFADVRNSSASTRKIGLGFEIEIGKDFPFENSERSKTLLNLDKENTIDQINVWFEVAKPTGPSNNRESYKVILKKSEVETLFDQNDQQVSESVKATWTSKVKYDLSDLSGLRRGDKKEYFSNYKLSNISDLVKKDIESRFPKPMIHGGLNSYFLPNIAFITYDSKEKMAMDAAKHISSSSLLGRAPSVELVGNMFRDLKANISRWLESQEIDTEIEAEFNRCEDFDEMIEALRPLLNRLNSKRFSGSNRLKISSSRLQPDTTKLKELEVIIYDTIHNFEGELYDFDIYRFPKASKARDCLSGFFSKGVRYLGPLRESPKPLYPLEPLPDDTDVGYKGEHTAAVFDLKKGERVDYAGPPLIDGSENKLKRATLESAVVDWLEYMGVITNITTSDQGKFGRELQVQTEGLKKYHDLTNVGVGVSQVLPIVVMALLADKGSTLIFEQPELHLHPKVQSRLADFFISQMIAGKQCIVETHSEYLIYRLRRRIAESTDENLEGQISIYFAKRNSGNSSVEKIKIDKFGAVQNWPADFFDETSSEIEKIIYASMKKKAAESTK